MLARLPLINRLLGPPAVVETDRARAHRLELIDRLTFEVVPMKNLAAAEPSLPAGAKVSVTASPTKGLSATQDVAERLIANGFTAIPHISARLVRNQDHTEELAKWFRRTGVSTIFLVGGDADSPGEYHDAIVFLRDLLETDHGLTTIGVAAYPDGHPFIESDILQDALHEKQTLLANAGIDAYCSTQMCFDPNVISNWLHTERSAGMTMPVHLGLSGVVDRSKLLTMGARLGIGQSLSYLRKNRKAITSMMTASHYDPNDLLIPLSQDMVDLDVDGLHVFTFNQVEATDRWRRGHRHRSAVG